MRNLTLAALAAAACVLGGCASAPKPPQASEHRRRPANDEAYVEMLKARVDLERARTELELQRRRSDAQRLVDEAQSLRPVVLRATSDRAVLSTATRSSNVVYTARFAVGGTRLALPSAARTALVAAARGAPLVMLRGRTDAARENPADNRIARLRAENVRTLLVESGMDASRIRVTWQGAGDAVASNATREGRALNRRVEIELYDTAPQARRLDDLAIDAAVAAK